MFLEAVLRAGGEVLVCLVLLSIAAFLFLVWLRQALWEQQQHFSLQHEYDHLDGMMFIDRLPPAKKLVLKKELALLAEGPI